jgi:uncharacterized membrane protein
MAEHRGAGVATPVSGRDPRLDRLLFLSDGVYTIALTLLVVELVLPETSTDLHGGSGGLPIKWVVASLATTRFSRD